MDRQSEDSFSGEALLEKSDCHSPKTSKSRFWIPFVLHAALAGIYTLVFLWMIQSTKAERIHGAGVIHTPARSAMIYEPKIYDVPLEVTSPYVGEPRPELDQAWHELLQYANIRVSADEMRLLGRLEEGILLPGGAGGGGYFGSLMAYHQLHCIKRLHHHLYPDYYFPNLTETERSYNRQHNAHCLDILRQGIQCQGDATLLTIRWGQRQAVPLGNFTGAHECVDWGRLEGWSRERSVDVFAAGALVHPVLGPSFPGGEVVDRIGVVEDH